MKHALIVLVASSSLAACVGEIGQIGGELGPGSGAAGATPVVSGVAGSASPTGAAGSSVAITGSTGAAGTGSVTGSGTGTAGTSATGAAGRAATGAAGSGAATCNPSGIPGDVAAVIASTCVACHGNPPIQGVPSSLTTYASLTAPAVTDPTKSVAVVALARMQGGAMPMPPPPLARATPAQIAAFQTWVSAGTPRATCPDAGAPAPDAGVPVPDAGGGIPDPFAVAPVCTSKTTWTRANSGSDQMNPGLACIACHTMMNRGPALTIAGTIYPTAHEPDLCNGGSVTTAARIVITGANGQVVTLTPNNAGNFRSQSTIAKPYTAKVTYMGRERVMLGAQTSGDCNSCHTQMGLMKAPGRILLP